VSLVVCDAGPWVCYSANVTTASALTLSALLVSRMVTADVGGVVRDASTGDPVPGAVVTLEDEGRSVVTDADGAYAFTGVRAGPQHLSVRILGFQSRSIHVLVPAEGTLRVDLVVHADPIEVEAVVVRSRILIRGADESGVDLDRTRQLSAAAIRNDPFTAEPDVLQALVGGAVSDTPESGGGLHVRGGDGDEVGYLLDGIPVFSPYHSGLRSGAWNPDAVARIELRSPDPTLVASGLAGAVLATTIEPGDRLGTRGELSTSQLGVTLDGPLGGESGFLVSGRLGYPGLIYPSTESSYVGGEDHDVLAKLVVPAGGGNLQALGFENRNIVRAASQPRGVGDPADAGNRNHYVWHGRSLGLTWEGGGSDGARPSLRAWRAGLDTSFLWHGDEFGLTRVESQRVQYGLQAALAWEAPWGSADLGVWTTRDRITYDLSLEDDAEASTSSKGKWDDVAAFARISRRIGERIELTTGLTAGAGTDGGALLPQVAATVRVARSASLYAEYSRSTQALQSLRNGESVVGRVFPAELYAGGDRSGIPEARANLGALGMLMAPWPGVRLDVEGYARSLNGLALIDPEDGRPFASDEGRRGSASILGGAVGLSVSAARYAALASFGAERVEIEAGQTEWVPRYAAGRTARVGAIAFPTPTLSIRIGWVGEFERRGTDTVGYFEWESCNLLDRGCEFAGSPETLGELGARRLPAYHRLDLSVRKHWHFHLGGRDGRLETYATGTNLLGRKNILVFVVDPMTGEATPIEMRPTAPLTVGLGWKF
jgi:hypothetical protein